MGYLRIRSIVIALLPAVLAGCGSAAFRGSQDWSGVTDPRLWRTCHVTNYGSGVVIRHDDRSMLVLTVAHLIEGETVDVHLPDRATGGYVSRRARVLAKSHPHKEDLALLAVDDPPVATVPFILPLADALKPGARRTVEVMNISFGAEAQPLSLKVPLFAHLAKIGSYKPDADGRTEWKIPKGLLHGGIRQANSGSPVFDGPRLVGLVESCSGLAIAPAGATVADRPSTAPAKSVLLIGVTVSLPQTIRAFVERNLDATPIERRP